MQKRNEFWWVHPAYRGEQSIDLANIGGMPIGAYFWVTSTEPDASRGDREETCTPVGHNDYADFAKLLYKLNGYCPGPVKGWYVVVLVCDEPRKLWAVGQLRADSQKPLQLFRDMVFESEQSARSKAKELRSQNPGVCRPQR